MDGLQTEQGEINESDSPPEDNAFDSPPEPVVTEASRESAVIEEDTSHFNYMLKRSQALWKTNLDTEDFCKLANTTMKLLEMRRKMMLLRTEADKQQKGGKTGGYFGAFND